MLTPALSFETIITAMMCLCSSEDNAASNMYQTDAIDEIYQRSLGSESVVIVKNDVMDLKEKIDTLEKSFKDIQSLQEKILQEMNIGSKADGITSSVRSVTECTAIKEITNLKLPEFQHPFQVLCNGDGWLVIQQRFDGTLNFFKTWAEYERGFGVMEGEFFIGLDNLHAITKAQKQQLRIEMEDFEGVQRYAQYDEFEIGSAFEGYPLKVLGNYTGNAGDSLRSQVSYKFSTFDRDNDMSDRNCAVDYTGAWWYNECETSNLNGWYFKGELRKENYGKGMSWDTFKGLGYSLKSVKMLIKPKK